MCLRRRIGRARVVPFQPPAIRGVGNVGGFQLVVEEAAPSGTAMPLDGATIVATIRPPRPHAPSEDELARHAAFLGKIKNPIWNRLDGRG